MILLILYLLIAAAVYTARRKRSRHPLLDAIIWPITVILFALAAALELLLTIGGE